ncbi:hypothetical protein PMIN01_02267 [Paraphaeosphaeria minitans]|uniref:Uncharacterized protein n=1 Tax=Paraphaeosphaeria minitans TaxID=565426 RepID=A0A9P6GQZ6_9PLEO|nr:hypothetical protein PMIN01_02267 [Paraphaeosphaeria minitans]
MRISSTLSFLDYFVHLVSTPTTPPSTNIYPSDPLPAATPRSTTSPRQRPRRRLNRNYEPRSPWRYDLAPTWAPMPQRSSRPRTRFVGTTTPQRSSRGAGSLELVELGEGWCGKPCRSAARLEVIWTTSVAGRCDFALGQGSWGPSAKRVPLTELVFLMDLLLGESSIAMGHSLARRVPRQKSWLACKRCGPTLLGEVGTSSENGSVPTADRQIASLAVRITCRFACVPSRLAARAVRSVLGLRGTTASDINGGLILSFLPQINPHPRRENLEASQTLPAKTSPTSGLVVCNLTPRRDSQPAARGDRLDCDIIGAPMAFVKIQASAGASSLVDAAGGSMIGEESRRRGELISAAGSLPASALPEAPLNIALVWAIGQPCTDSRSGFSC